MGFKKKLRHITGDDRSTGILLILCTLISLALANADFGISYLHFWETKLAGLSVEHWINDGLMSIFFFQVGLELVREAKIGQLANIKNAMLPVFAALGGMLIPAAIYLLFNYGTATQSGAGIPMATDIAFAVGVLSLLGKRVPISLKIFLLALAIIDDLGAIMVIAVFYSKGLLWTNLLMAAAIWIVLWVLNRAGVKNLFFYLVGGIGIWYAMLHSGIHATIAGVLLALVIPFGNGGRDTAAYRVMHFLHKPVNFFILPVFALANTAIILEGSFAETLSQDYSKGIAAGLIIGKPLGIVSFALAAVMMRVGKLPSGLNWKAIFGVGLLGGIGFTMSVFITLLAFEDGTIINQSKLIILLSSLLAGAAGFILLKIVLRNK